MEAPGVLQNRENQVIDVDAPIAKAAKKKAFRFAAKHDVLLLREVAAHNPFLFPTMWNNIASTLSGVKITVDGRRCRERTALQLEYFIKQDKENLRRSGTEEEYAEKEQLLQELVDLRKDAESNKELKAAIKKKIDADIVAGQEIRNEAMRSLKAKCPPASEQSCRPVETRKRRAKEEVLQYLKDKSEKDFELKDRKLKLEEQKLALDEKRHEADREERKLMMELLMKKLA